MSSEPLRLGEPAIGFRTWRIDGENLVALRGDHWPTGDHLARCLRRRRHDAPAEDCGCGLYAWHEPPDQNVPPAHVVGAVVAWGRLLVHADGFRAQYARPIALTASGSAAAELAQVSRRYKLQVVRAEQLSTFASEFGKAVPFTERPVDTAGLLTRVNHSIWKRESLQRISDLITGPADRYTQHVLALLASDPSRSLLDTLWLASCPGSERMKQHCDWDAGLRAFRHSVSELLAAQETGESPPLELGLLMSSLQSAHGLTVSRVNSLMSSNAAARVSDAHVFHPDVLPLHHPVSRARARALLASKDPLLGGGFGSNPLLAVLDELTDEQLHEHLPRLPSSIAIEETLRRLGDRAPALAWTLLHRSHPLCTRAAAEVLGGRARPLLLRMLARNPYSFYRGRHTLPRRIVGDEALRLAADRQLRHARDPVEAIRALALLPGEEGKAAVNRLFDRINRLDRCEPEFRIYERAWNGVCSSGLVELLEPGLVEHALTDASQDLTNQALILRAHPSTTSNHAARLWMREDISARFALGALNAAGRERRTFIKQTLAAAETAATDRAAAARLTAVLATDGADHPAARRIAVAVAQGRQFPATLRGVACWVAKQRTSDASNGEPDDPVRRRYDAWLQQRAPKLRDPLNDLVSGAWLFDTLAP